MSGQLDHVAVNTAAFEETLHFYETIFQMTLSRTAGEQPCRKAWFHQGIQVNEVAADTQPGHYDHLAIRVPDRKQIMQRALEYGCNALADRPNWLCTKDGTVIELLP